MQEETDISGITVGKKFFEDIKDYDVREEISDFTKPVLILQGSEDNIVLPSVTKEASELYPDSEYHIIDGAGHGFSGEYHDEATEYALDFRVSALLKEVERNLRELSVGENVLLLLDPLGDLASELVELGLKTVCGSAVDDLHIAADLLLELGVDRHRGRAVLACNHALELAGAHAVALACDHVEHSLCADDL